MAIDYIGQGNLMDRLHCKACGCISMTPMDVDSSIEESDELHTLLNEKPESQFYTCPVCGDNWLSVKEVRDTGQCTFTFVHQMGIDPVLKRIAHTQGQLMVDVNAVREWKYYLDDKEIDQEIWFDKLFERRQILKSICSN